MLLNKRLAYIFLIYMRHILAITSRLDQVENHNEQHKTDDKHIHCQNEILVFLKGQHVAIEAKSAHLLILTHWPRKRVRTIAELACAQRGRASEREREKCAVCSVRIHSVFA